MKVGDRVINGFFIEGVITKSPYLNNRISYIDVRINDTTYGHCETDKWTVVKQESDVDPYRAIQFGDDPFAKPIPQGLKSGYALAYELSQLPILEEPWTEPDKYWPIEELYGISRQWEPYPINVVNISWINDIEPAVLQLNQLISKSCECGSESVGSQAHSTWCPKVNV